MNFQGINGKGRVVIPTASKEEKELMQANPVYKFVRWLPLVEVAKVEAPAEVENAEPVTNKHNNGDSNTNDRPSGATKRRKRGGSQGSDRG